MSERSAPGEPGRHDPAGRGPVFRASRPSALSRPNALRTFLTSNTGGGLMALAAVLLIVVVLLAVRATPAGTRDAASRSGTGSGSGHPAASGTSTPVGSPGASPTVSARPSAKPPKPRHPVIASAPSANHLVASHQPLTVLNNTVVHGLAHQAASTFAAHGWPVVSVGNYAGQLPTTTVYFTPGHADEQAAAQALARAFPKITRVLPHDPHLPVSARGVIVVIAPNWLT